VSSRPGDETNLPGNETIFRFGENRRKRCVVTKLTMDRQKVPAANPEQSDAGLQLHPCRSLGGGCPLHRRLG
jgi:hypothetical protein